MSESQQGAAVRSDSASLVPPYPRDPSNGWRSDTAPDATVDGRRARALRTHQAVLDGLKECLEIGISQPTAKQVAERAGVSLRGVFRHFDHLDTLLLELDKREHQRIAKSLRPCSLGAPVEKRIDSFLKGCSRINEGTAVVRRALQRYSATSDALDRYRDRQRLLRHEKIMKVFEGELASLSGPDRRERVQEISALTSWSQWEELRRYEHMPVLRTRKILARKMAAILAT